MRTAESSKVMTFSFLRIRKGPPLEQPCSFHAGDPQAIPCCGLADRSHEVAGKCPGLGFRGHGLSSQFYDWFRDFCPYHLTKQRHLYLHSSLH